MTTGEKLRTMRLRHNMTLAQLAAASHLSKGFLSQIEHGLANPSLDSLRRIASSLGVALSELIEDDSHALPVGTHRGAQAERRGSVLVVHGRDLQTNAGIEELAAMSESALIRVILPPGSRLDRSNVTGIAGAGSASSGELAMAVCLPVRGNVSLQQGEQMVTLFTGDVATWDASRPYTLENRARSTALVFMVIPRAVGLPAITFSGRQAAKMPAGIEHMEGPFRLVAMRAARRQLRGD